MARGVETHFVVNPKASGGRALRVWNTMAPRFHAAISGPRVHFTSGPKDATHLTRAALREGAELVVSVGGDGTLNEVVNGFFLGQEPVKPGAALGLFMVGTGGDFRKTLDLPHPPAAQLERLLAGRERVLDLGRLTFTRLDGGTEERYFQNIASFGLSGATDAAVNALTWGRALGGKVAYQWGLLKALIGYKNQPVRIRVDDHFDEVITVNMAAVCNGQYFGGGMRVAPEAEPDDGLFDVVIVGDIGKGELLRRVNKVYTGAHIGMERVFHLRGRRVVAEPVDAASPVLIDLDGEMAGCLPAVFEVAPGAVRVRV
ncbi:MAG: hypothetical protein RLZZ303_248 [Candidatus Hydrogenedentota bacterium]|jgi:YegS/Rv2252/BmrU family lipid kinase